MKITSVYLHLPIFLKGIPHDKEHKSMQEEIARGNPLILFIRNAT